MKLRLHRDSLRLRLTPAEVVQLRDAGSVESTIHFPTAALRCHLQTHPEATSLTAALDASTITVSLPSQQARHWAASDDVGISSKIHIPPDRTLHILIEKDFQCLHDRAADQAEILYPNPLNASAGHM